MGRHRVEALPTASFDVLLQSMAETFKEEALRILYLELFSGHVRRRKGIASFLLS